MSLSSNSIRPQRKIIHIDMDCFFAAVEMRENPGLIGKPVAVGGKPDTRGVVAACNYKARKFGVHSAMAMSKAMQKCPSLIIVPVRIPLYKQVSTEIHAIFREYTDLIEPLSLDEAYLDVSATEECRGSATLLARKIRQKIYQSQHLTASAGVAPNKFLAKVASDWNKPNGQKVVSPEQVSEFVFDLPVKCISGVGKVTAKKMESLGLRTCGDLQALDMIALNHHFGRFGERLYHYSRGIDSRPVTTRRIRKSLSVEDTFPQDLPDLVTCLIKLDAIYDKFIRRYEQLEMRHQLSPRTLFIKLRFNNFATTTTQAPGKNPQRQVYRHLCEVAWQRGKRPVRLIGLGLQFGPPAPVEQLQLFE